MFPLACSPVSVRRRWQLLVLWLAGAVLATGCAAQTRTFAPTMTPLPYYATAAADPGWLALQERPLHLPALAPGAACPHARGHLLAPEFNLALGDGPAYPIPTVATEEGGVLHYVDASHYTGGKSGWGGEKVLWVIAPTYQGLVLIRGGQIDGPHALGFNGGVDQPETYAVEPPPIAALRLMAPQPGAAGQWANWPSQTRLQAPGCYAYQVDGSGFSAVIVFQAVPVA